MKGFLSFSGITLITVAFGSILFSFYGSPLEDFKSQERQLAYQEMRENHSADKDKLTVSHSSFDTADNTFYIEAGQSCIRSADKQ